MSMYPEWVKHMSGSEFVAMANKILGDDDKYEDEIVCIHRNFNGLDLQIERKPMPNIRHELRVPNPVTMVVDGEIIRHHGEHCWIVSHMEKLSKFIDNECILNALQVDRTNIVHEMSLWTRGEDGFLWPDESTLSDRHKEIVIALDKKIDEVLKEMENSKNAD